jgi:hypothetical protein
MAINSIYRKYFQKSKIFLYPLLDIKRGTSIVPEETYLSWNEDYSPEDMKLVCVYKTKDESEYRTFEKNVLLKHIRLHEYNKIDDTTSVFIFDFSDLAGDWEYFCNGKYSKISVTIKNKILNYFDKYSANHTYVESYLFPIKHYKKYAELLACTEELLISVGELCSVPDLEKEKLLIKVANLENIKILD